MRFITVFLLLIGLVSSPVYAFDKATHLKDYVQNGTQPASKKGMLKAKLANGSIVDVARKANLAKAAIAIGTTVAYYYYEDELDKSLYELFLGDEPSAPPVSTYSAGYFWYKKYNGHRASTPEGVMALEYGTTTYNFVQISFTPHSAASYSVRRKSDGAQVTVASLGAQVCGAAPASASYCIGSPPGDFADDVPMYQVEGGSAVQPVNEVDLMPFPDNRWMEVETAPDQVRQRVKVEVLPNGNTRVTTQTEYLDENGNTRTKTDVVETNADGEVVSESSSDTEGNLDSAAAEEAAKGPQDVNVLNDDLQVTVNEDNVPVDPALTNDVPPAYQPYKPIDDYFGPGGAAIPDLPVPSVPFPDFDHSSGCSTVPLSYHGETVMFPSNSQCSKLNVFKEIVGWMMAVLTMFSVVKILTLGRT